MANAAPQAAQVTVTTIRELRRAVPSLLASSHHLHPPTFNANGIAHNGSTKAEWDAVANILEGCEDVADFDNRVASVAQANRLNPEEVARLDVIQFAKKLTRKRKSNGSRGTRRPRRRTLPSERQLTPNEIAALHAYGECQANTAAAARMLGKDRKTVSDQIENGLAKLGRKSKSEFLKSSKLPSDNRGQLSIGIRDPEPRD